MNDTKRRDPKGRILRTGESWRSDGRYMFRYIDNEGKRQSIYSRKLFSTDRVDGKCSDEPSLRELEESIRKDLKDNINSNGGKITLDNYFLIYMETKTRLALSTRNNYMGIWQKHIWNSKLGRMRIVDIKKSHILQFYRSLAENHGMSDGTIQLYQNMLYPCFELAVDDDLIRKNPCKGCMKNYTGNGSKTKEALTIEQQERMLDFVARSNTYNIYLPMLKFMLLMACRCGETIGLTWKDIDFDKREISINHQLIYKKVGDRICFYAKQPKTQKGIRVIPFTEELAGYLAMQKQYQKILGIKSGGEVDGYSGFVFTTRKGKPIQPNCLNRVLDNIVRTYNNEETKTAEKEKREPLLIPRISAHTLRHTACTRMAEKGMDVKTLQYIMGHSNISVTMDVYNHVDKRRVADEVKRLEDNGKEVCKKCC